jgi:hypothetical protein
MINYRKRYYKNYKLAHKTCCAYMKLTVKRNRFITIYQFDLGDFKVLKYIFFSRNLWAISAHFFFSYDLILLSRLLWVNPAVASSWNQYSNQHSRQKAILLSPLPCRNQSCNHPLPVRNQSCNNLYLSGINPKIIPTCQESILQSPLPVRNQSYNHLYLSYQSYNHAPRISLSAHTFTLNQAYTITSYLESVLWSPLLFSAIFC